MLLKKVVTVACMLLLVALGPALVASAAPSPERAPVATWWSGVTQWWATSLAIVFSSTDDDADIDTEDVGAPPPELSQTIPPGGETESNPTIDPDG